MRCKSVQDQAEAPDVNAQLKRRELRARSNNEDYQRKDPNSDKLSPKVPCDFPSNVPIYQTQAKSIGKGRNGDQLDSSGDRKSHISVFVVAFRRLLFVSFQKSRRHRAMRSIRQPVFLAGVPVCV